LLQVLSLKYHTPVIEIINNQGEFINRPQFFFKENSDGHFDMVGKHNSLQKENGKQNSHEELGKKQ
jgi:hypothetical protein